MNRGSRSFYRGRPEYAWCRDCVRYIYTVEAVLQTIPFATQADTFNLLALAAICCLPSFRADPLITKFSEWWSLCCRSPTPPKDYHSKTGGLTLTPQYVLLPCLQVTLLVFSGHQPRVLARLGSDALRIKSEVIEWRLMAAFEAHVAPRKQVGFLLAKCWHPNSCSSSASFWETWG